MTSDIMECANQAMNGDQGMSSPFPGMNPFLEQRAIWHMFHERIIVRAADILTAILQPRYAVLFDDNIYLHELSAEERRLLGRPDVGIVPGTGAVQSKMGASISSAAPAYGFAVAAVDELRESFIEIRDGSGRDLITVLEMLSPSNKYAGPDREQYLAKRRQYLRSSANFIEIDLLRGGPRMPLVGMPDCDYCVVVRRVKEYPRVGIWPISLRERLPEIPIPLRDPDPDATLDLQSLLDDVYEAGGYQHTIYSGSPEPPLSPPDQEWAEEIVRQSMNR